ncbi:DUF1653 domain-containing protein [Lachnospiraceae bacterium MD335]|jgi:hypothetical protein|nr:hypothetical protein C809_03575 [Lachnospiraceae bacterium MD335]NDO51095.1 DUF1653 domain-containing protein [Lachnospiraceae bacterium MD335]
MRPNPKPQEIYRHFKGNVYQIITIARHSETKMKMVVYQQLYAPYEVYVRPLDMFMSKIDTKKYPNEKQIFRFERLAIRGEDQIEETRESSAETLNRILNRGKKETELTVDLQKADGQEEAFELDPGLVEFLDADSYEKKLQILSSLHNRITDAMIDTMAVSLDTEVKEGDIETRYAEIRNCLITMERFECNRLR